jgi:hypothetical protein
VFLRGRDKLHDLFFGFRVHHEIGNSSELCVLDRVHFFLRVPVTVPQPVLAVRVELTAG